MGTDDAMHKLLDGVDAPEQFTLLGFAVQAVRERMVRGLPGAEVRRVVMACGHLDLGDSWHGGRPYQCVHQRDNR